MADHNGRTEMLERALRKAWEADAVVCTVGVRYLPGFKNEAADAVEPKEPP